MQFTVESMCPQNSGKLIEAPDRPRYAIVMKFSCIHRCPAWYLDSEPQGEPASITITCSLKVEKPALWRNPTKLAGLASAGTVKSSILIIDGGVGKIPL